MITALVLFGLTLISWLLLTFFVAKPGPEKEIIIGKENKNPKAVIVYDPDPIYNLDEKVCRSFAQGLSERGWMTKIITVASASKIEDEYFDLYVFCANTYNWAPDKAIKDYIKNLHKLRGKKVVAFTLGSGSTKRAQRILERLLIEKEAELIESKSLWLVKPNDQSQKEQSNVKLAEIIAKNVATSVVQKLKNQDKNSETKINIYEN